MDDYQAFMKAMHPSVPDSGVARSWNKLKCQFTYARDADYKDIQSLINITSFVSAFRAASQLSAELSGLSTISSGIPPPMTTLSISSPLHPSWGTSSSSRGSCINSDDGNSGSSFGSSYGSSKRGSSNRSGGSDGSGSSHIPADQVAMMNELLKYNFEQFPSLGWMLPSGATIDSLLFGVATNQRYESSLHSFVVEDSRVNKPGETISQASQNRRNDCRTLISKQLTGLKADRLVYGTAKNLEYCVLEMVKIDQGQFANEAFNDTRKPTNMMKDMGDKIRKLATVNVRDRLVVYDMTMAKTLLAMRKAIMVMAGQALDWIALPLDGSAHEDSDSGN
ncbi:hypothetical protein BGX24_001427 [Mortierella sp. AD032]|nr:hypothetical protein BGX24_001427 [Mortierella sp. AD032]